MCNTGELRCSSQTNNNMFYTHTHTLTRRGSYLNIVGKFKMIFYHIGLPDIITLDHFSLSKFQGSNKAYCNICAINKQNSDELRIKVCSFGET